MSTFRRKSAPVIRIDENGTVVQYNDKLGRWEQYSRPWSWDDITPGYKRESKRNYKNNR